MGQQLSVRYFEQYIEEARAFSAIIKVIYREAEVKLLLGTLVYSPSVVLKDYIGSVKFLISYRRSSGYSVTDALSHDDWSRRVMSSDDYNKFKILVCNLKSTLAAGAAPTPAVTSYEECSVCLDAAVEVVLPCSHSFCAKCAHDWRQNNPTCPCCRENLLEASSDWQLECWNQEDLKQQFYDLCNSISEFIDTLPVASSAILSTHRVLDMTDDQWRMIFTRPDARDGTHTEDSDLKVNRFMRT
jgi:hypothetical protein